MMMTTTIFTLGDFPNDFDDDFYDSNINVNECFREVFARFSQGFREVFARFSRGFRKV